jgi:pyruvate dehydrogenase E1 component alpha subunit
LLKKRFYAKKTKDQINVKLNDYMLHRLDTSPKTEVVATKKELLEYYTEMSLIRRVEIASQNLYQKRQIRGFLHLYNGQEAVCTGLDSVLTPKDGVITAYRDHGYMLTKRVGGTAKEVLAELVGKTTGCSKGKGGSMHMYKIDRQFFGGNGIVGAQIPVGTGVAFAYKYMNRGNVCVALMGDGAANQGQVYESFNMAKLWNLPVIYVVENNKYGMGTSVNRASATKFFYTRGDYIPGIQLDGMNVLSVREATKYAVDHALKNGPIVLEMITYRYKGHSMSDPGISYRSKDEVLNMEENSDPIKFVQSLLIKGELATEEEILKIDEHLKAEVEEATKFALESADPPKEELYTDIYAKPETIRGRVLEETFVPK